MDVVFSIIFGALFFGLLAYTAKNAGDAMETFAEFVTKYGPYDND